ncbi:MAG: GTPase [Thermoplasmata archaeon]|nr:MAG: GTPase [Thermoplasmata archaeon]
MPENVIIMGAAGRDFHNFNTHFRGNQDYNVVAFTAAQIPNIHDRVYPAALAGQDRYPEGIPIRPEDELPLLISKYKVTQVIFSYSDLNYNDLMHKASIVLAAGADFRLMSMDNTILKSSKPVISICAVRTGVGKSPTTRKICKLLRDRELKVVAVRHPMPYGNLMDQIWQRFETYEDLDKYECTIEEREEYEPHIDMGTIVYAGVDYAEILKRAEEDADVVVWDGGNNDLPFFKPNLHIVLVDPHRAGHEELYYPGETNLRLADIVIINKVSTADAENVKIVRNNVKRINPNAEIIEANSPITVEQPEELEGKRVLVVEDGPTVTHGEMPYGAGFIAAKSLKVGEIIDPRKYAVDTIKETFEAYPHLESVLPAMGYGSKQVKDLEATINACDCDFVIAGTPIDLNRVVSTNKTIKRAKYAIEEQSELTLEKVVEQFLEKF